jgi:late embryogenesis abundant protein
MAPTTLARSRALERLRTSVARVISSRRARRYHPLMRQHIVPVLITLGMFGCAPLRGQHMAARPLIFEPLPVTQPTILPSGVRLIAPRAGLPGGGALVTLATRVLNPNTFEVTLQRLKGTLYMEERKVGTADLRPSRVLKAGADTQMEIDVVVDFSGEPTVETIVRRAREHQRMHYRLEGTISLDASRVGSGMVFGPTTLVDGEMNGPADPNDRVNGSANQH